MLTILPADSYTVINKSVISDKDKKLITLLYQPIIGNKATSLYFTLLDDLDKQEIISNDFSHHHLMSLMQEKLESIVIAREKLEAVGLLKTYVKSDSINHYVYLLYSPMTAKEFFEHPLLNVVLYNNLGKIEYEELKSFFKTPRINLKDYKDITASLSEVFSPIRGRIIENTTDIIEENTTDIIINKIIDFDMLITSIPKNMLNDKCFSKEIKELINLLAYTYNISDIEMQGLVRDSLNERGLIDKESLRKSCRNFYQFESNGSLPTLVYNKQPEYLKKPAGDNSKWAKMVYTFENISPYEFLKAKYKGAEPTSRDLKLIENLLVDQKLKPGVVNVLLAYVLKINNQKLNKNYIETITGQWKRLNVETVEEAMRITEKEHKKTKKLVTNKKSYISKKSTKEENLPAWFDKELEKTDLSKEEAEDISKILDELV